MLMQWDKKNHFTDIDLADQTFFDKDISSFEAQGRDKEVYLCNEHS